MNVAFIPVRGGSKSIPLKNIKKFAGKPLVYWCVSAANNASHVDLVVVATDSKQIKEYVAGLNLPKVYIYDRLPENATDTASTESVMLEFLQAKHNDICLKQEDNFICNIISICVVLLGDGRGRFQNQTYSLWSLYDCQLYGGTRLGHGSSSPIGTVLHLLYQIRRDCHCHQPNGSTRCNRLRWNGVV